MRKMYTKVLHSTEQAVSNAKLKEFHSIKYMINVSKKLSTLKCEAIWEKIKIKTTHLQQRELKKTDYGKNKQTKKNPTCMKKKN